MHAMKKDIYSIAISDVASDFCVLCNFAVNPDKVNNCDM